MISALLHISFSSHEVNCNDSWRSTRPYGHFSSSGLIPLSAGKDTAKDLFYFCVALMRCNLCPLQWIHLKVIIVCGQTIFSHLDRWLWPARLYAFLNEIVYSHLISFLSENLLFYNSVVCLGSLVLPFVLAGFQGQQQREQVVTCISSYSQIKVKDDLHLGEAIW